MEYVLAIQVLE